MDAIGTIGTVVALTALVGQLYTKCENVSKGFYNLHTDLRSLHEVLPRVKQYVPEGENPSAIQGCYQIAKDIEKLLSKYEGTGTTKRKLWHAFKWHFEDIAQLRSRLMVHVGILNLRSV